MKKNKKIIITLIFLMIIMFAIIVGIIFILNGNDGNINVLNEGDAGETVEYNAELKNLEDKEIFFTVETCINQYLSELNDNNASYYGKDDNGNYVKIISDTETAQMRLNLLSNNYIKENNITNKNINQKIELLEEELIFLPINMKIIAGENINNCIVYGIITDLENNYIKDLYLIINLDKENKTFSVTPLNEKYNNIEEIQIKYNGDSIEEKDNNTYRNQVLSYEEIAKKYLIIYKRVLLAKPELAYEYLEEEYKNTKFKTYEEFKEYIDMKKDEISTMYATGYTFNSGKEYNEIFVKDQYSNIYTIKEKYVMKFDIRLDDYTILSEENIEKYNNSSDKEKITINLKRVIEAINHKDYQYIYNKINETFRNNNFDDIEKLKTYLNTKFYDKNNIEFLTYTNEGNVYMYNLKIKNAEKESNYNELKIMIKLLEGTDFEISFSI